MTVPGSPFQANPKPEFRMITGVAAGKPRDLRLEASLPGFQIAMGEEIELPTRVSIRAARARFVNALRNQGVAARRSANLGDSTAELSEGPAGKGLPWLTVDIEMPENLKPSKYLGYVFNKIGAMIAAAGSTSPFEVVPPPDPTPFRENRHPLVRIFAWAKILLGQAGVQHDIALFTFSTPQLGDAFGLPLDNDDDLPAILARLQAVIDPQIPRARLGDNASKSMPKPSIDRELTKLYFALTDGRAYLEMIKRNEIHHLIPEFTTYIVAMFPGLRRDLGV